MWSFQIIVLLDDKSYRDFLNLNNGYSHKHQHAGKMLNMMESVIKVFKSNMYW